MDNEFPILLTEIGLMHTKEMEYHLIFFPFFLTIYFILVLRLTKVSLNYLLKTPSITYSYGTAHG